MAQTMLRRPRKKTAGLMLIPLVDVIFLLLTFFMLASRIDPFSLLTLDEYESRAGGQPAGSAAQQVQPDLVLSVSRGVVRANGEPVALKDFAVRSRALHGGGLETVVVYTRADATVQDIVSVLDALKKASFRSVVIRSRGEASG